MFNPGSGESSDNRLTLGTRSSVPQHGLVYHRARRLQGLYKSYRSYKSDRSYRSYRSNLKHLSGVAAGGFGDLSAGEHTRNLFDTAAAIECLNADLGAAGDRFLAHEKM